MAGQLQPLSFASRKRRHRLSQAHILQTDIGKRSQAILHVSQPGKKVQRFADSHVQYVIDGCASAQMLDADLKHFGPESLAVAIRAAQVDVGQELHLDVFKSGATAGRAASVAGIEAERAGSVAPFLCKGCLREKLADGIERSYETGGVRAGSFADRGLVNHDNVGNLVGTQQVTMRTRRLYRLALLSEQCRVQDVLHKSGFSRPRHTCQANKTTQRDRDRDVLN